MPEFTVYNHVGLPVAKVGAASQAEAQAKWEKHLRRRAPKSIYHEENTKKLEEFREQLLALAIAIAIKLANNEDISADMELRKHMFETKQSLEHMLFLIWGIGAS